MDLNNVFRHAIIRVFFAGLLVFMVTIPFLVVMLYGAGRDWQLMLIGSLVMYLVYCPVQILLSALHWLITTYLTQGQKKTSTLLLPALLGATYLLLIVIYAFLLWSEGDPDSWLFALFIFMPYILACTVSAFIYYSYHRSKLIHISTTTTQIP